MSTTIQIKRSSTASGVPLATDLAVGELAVNLADKRLFTKQSDGTVIELSTNPTDLDAATLRIDGVEITASATELNKLDGFTGSTSELNILDGLTATTLELNKLDGFTGTVDDLNYAKDLRATGVTTTEFDKLDGLTATTAELNTLDGITATTTELNHTDGVTSNIQTQLNAMVEKAGDTMTGDLSLGDSVKAKFGAGDDLQIYHDSTTGHSYIKESGSGDLILQAGNDLRLEDPNGNEYLRGNEGAGVDIAYNGSTKLATTATGVDVTGTVTADGLTVDGVVSVDGNIGIDTSHVFGQGLGYGGNTTSAGAGTMALYDATTGGVIIDGFAPSYLEDSGVVLKQSGVKGFHLKNNNDVHLYEDTGTTAKFVWDSSAESLGIGTSSPASTLDVRGARPDLLRLYSTDAGGDAEIELLTLNSASTVGKISKITATQVGSDTNGSILSFSTSPTNSNTPAERLRIDSSGNVGIGTSSPSSTLDVRGRFTVDSNDGHSDTKIKSVTNRDPRLYFLEGATQRGFVQGIAGSNTLLFGTGTTERLRIDSSGRVGIGTSSPVEKLYVNSTSGDARIGLNAPTGSDTEIKFSNNGTVEYSIGHDDATDNFVIGTTNVDAGLVFVTKSGNVGIGTASPSVPLQIQGDGNTLRLDGTANTSRGILLRNAGTSTAYLKTDGNLDINCEDSGRHIAFKTADTERARIDSSGNLLVGKTSTSFGTDGVEIKNDQIWSTNTSSDCISLNRKTTDGAIATFYKDGSTVGSIGVYDGRPFLASSTVGIRISNALFPCNTSGVIWDNAIDIGGSSGRWNDIYATNGTIQTSDRNEKQDIETLSDAEQRVAKACKGLLRKFRWIDAVEEKGDDARIHFGIIAQDLKDAFEAEGLDAGRYAMFISSTWTDEETGEERTRLGVRYPELLAFIIASI